MAIRSAIGSDAGRISALLTGLAEEFIIPAFSAEGRKQLLADFAAEEIAQRLDSADYRFHVAETGDEIAGVVAMRGPTHLYLLFVGKPFQRSGLARRLWEVARENARSPAGPFSVNASSYAVPAYRRLGFRLAGPAQERNGVQFQPMEWAADPADAR